MSLNVLRKNLGIYGANTYILYDDNKDAVVIDCGGDADEVEKLLKENDLKALALILTHGHFDHIAGMNDLREITGAPIYGCEKERDLFEDAEKNLSKTTLVGAKTLKCDHYFNEGDELAFGDIKLKVLATPGHTEGSVCLYNDEMVFTGDTLFNRSVGRSDLYSGNQSHLNESLKKMRDTFDGKLIVYPGHGPESTMKFEVENNPYITGLV